MVQRLQLVDTSLRLVAADTSIYIVLACGTRLASRWLHEWGRRMIAGQGAPFRRVVIVGAGESGCAVIKNMLASPKLRMDPVAAVDDDVSKHRSRLQGVPVVGPIAELPTVVRKYQPATAHHLLNLSFAQYRADSAVVRDEARLQKLRADLARAERATVCERGDVVEYAALRRAALRAAKRTPSVHDQIVVALGAVRPGHVLSVPGVKAKGRVAVLKSDASRST